jgi:RimJ/RimL family protein N-acetyltransferase
MAFSTPRVRVAPLVAQDGPALQEVLEASTDYFQLVTGLPPGRAEAASLFQFLPEGATYGQKVLLGLFDPQGVLIGVLDAIRDYPARRLWSLGLLLLVPTWRGSGLGSEVFQAFQRWAVGLGAETLRLGVASVNVRALAFWRRLGFEVRERKTMPLGVRQGEVMVLTKSVP